MSADRLIRHLRDCAAAATSHGNHVNRAEARVTDRGVFLLLERRDGSECAGEEITFQAMLDSTENLAERAAQRCLARMRAAE